jgi:uncharacterized protein YbjT (DUF2867 family)
MSQKQTGRGHVVIVFGSTGTAGTGAIHAALADPRVTEVRAVVRRPLGFSHPKIREVHCSDFADLGPISQAFEGVGCCLYCLGTSVRNVEGEDEYRLIHVCYPLAAAGALMAGSPDACFVYLSGAGAKRSSRMMWARVKAEAEDELADLGLARHATVRPAAILPVQPTGANRWILASLLTVIPALGIRSVDLGRAMLHLGLDRSWRGSRTLENRELKTLLRSIAQVED